nr:MAG TPA: hypothetical protein [Caudoviricetes sp.]
MILTEPFLPPYIYQAWLLLIDTRPIWQKYDFLHLF